MSRIHCRHCNIAIEIDPEKLGGLYRCPACRKLNSRIGSDASETVRFGDYELIQEIGQGANAIVCKGLKRKTGEIFAIKLFHTESNVDSLSKREFMREISFCIELEHKNIVRTYLGEEMDGILFLELEYIDGINLAQYLEYYGPMEQFEALNVGTHVAYALDFVWSNYLSIHRDIKPQNVMLNSNGDVKVCDFGMVTAHENAAVDISAVEGTPYYLSPECVTDGAYQDNRSDIYSLGATLFHVITDVPPFDYDSLMEVIHARVKEEAPDIRQHLPSIDSALADVVRTMMARDPDDRYVTAYECLEDMQRVKNGQKPVLVDKFREKTNQ